MKWNPLRTCIPCLRKSPGPNEPEDAGQTRTPGTRQDNRASDIELREIAQPARTSIGRHYSTIERLARMPSVQSNTDGSDSAGTGSILLAPDSNSSKEDRLNWLSAPPLRHRRPGSDRSTSPSLSPSGGSTQGRDARSEGTEVSTSTRSGRGSPAAPVPASMRVLAPAAVRMSHRMFGELAIGRLQKTADRREVMFELDLSKCESPQRMKHVMYVVDEDDLHGLKSTLGYGEINLSLEMRNKGVGYAYHFVAARAARELGVNYLVVDNAVNNAMKRLCENIGMIDDFSMSCYEADPQTVMKNAHAKLSARGWQVLPDLEGLRT